VVAADFRNNGQLDLVVRKSGGGQIVRELFPVNSFRSQMPSVVHFGLGDETSVDRLIIRWPLCPGKPFDRDPAWNGHFFNFFLPWYQVSRVNRSPGRKARSRENSASASAPFPDRIKYSIKIFLASRLSGLRRNHLPARWAHFVPGLLLDKELRQTSVIISHPGIHGHCLLPVIQGLLNIP
jgi:hypothetical protein